MLEILCSQCGRRYKVKDEMLGKRVRCAGCKTEFEAKQAPSLMELALLQPASKLRDAIQQGSLGDLGFFLAHQFTLINIDDREGYVPLSTDLNVEGKRYTAILVFTSNEAAGVFAHHNPQVLEENGGDLAGFVIDGFTLVEHTPANVSLLIDCDSDEALLLRPEDWEPLRKALKQFKKDPKLKASIPPPHPEARVQVQLGDTANNIRNQSFAYLDYMGFQCARWLPAPDTTRQLRPAKEIAGRLAALAGVFAWASAPPEALPSSTISDYFKKSSLGKYLTKEEAAIVTTPRKQAMEKHQFQVGWRLENMWPLAWVLGYEHEPDIDGAQIDESISMSIVFEFLDKVTISLDDLLKKSQVRPALEVIAKEDLFYCAHNAVRSAQTGHASVPAGFDPVSNGGVIHERRHALTWCLSPGVPWHATDLNT